MKPLFYSLYATELLRLGIAEEQAALYFESMAPLCQSGATRSEIFQLHEAAKEQSRQVAAVLATLTEPPSLPATELRPQIAEEIFALTPSHDAFSLSDESLLDAVGGVHNYVLEQLHRTMAFANLIGESNNLRQLESLYGPRFVGLPSAVMI